MSFTAALQTVAASYTQIASVPPEQGRQLAENAATALRSPRVGHRPNRVEPRAVKRRPKPHPLLTKPRAEARAALLQRHQT
jgi:hypothetical protein